MSTTAPTDLTADRLREMGYLYSEATTDGIDVSAHTDGTVSIDWSTAGDGVVELDIDAATELMLMLAAAITAARKA